MIDGTEAVAAFRNCGFTHIVWIPDSELGQWDAALSSAEMPRLVRATREGEAIALAGGLWLGGARPLTILQCTGFFEAGDAFRNFVHDLKLPLVFLIGVRSYHAYREGRSNDTCPVFMEPILQAWRLPFSILEKSFAQSDLEGSLQRLVQGCRAGAVLLGE